MVTKLKTRHELANTTIILSAKHGQSPVAPSAPDPHPDAPILHGPDVAWAADHLDADKLVVRATDDAMIVWLSDRSQAAAEIAKVYLLHHDGSGNDINGAPRRSPPPA